MRAIVMKEPGPPDVLEIGEVATPVAGPGEVLVEVTAAGVNRADLLQRQGHYPPPPGASEIIGLEVSGRIAELGEGVDGWWVGDSCVALLAGGGYAAYVAVPAGQVVPPPPGVDPVEAAGLIEVAATVYANLGQARLADGEVFLVHGGSGGIGAFAIQWAKVLGATVIATAGSDDKLEYCRQLGADHALSYREDWPAAVREVTGGRGVDVVLDPIGAKYLSDHVRLLTPDGRIVTIGMQGGTQGTLDLGALLKVRGSVSATSLRARPTTVKAAICAGVVGEVWPRIADGTIALTRHTAFPLAEAAAAHAHLESGDNLGKLILTVA